MATMNTTSSTPRGMRNYKPRRPGVTIDDVVTPESRARQQAMVQEAKDDAMQGTLEKLYEGARTTPTDGMKAGGKVSSASKRADGCAVRGKTKGKII